MGSTTEDWSSVETEELGMDAMYLGNRLFIGKNKKEAFQRLKQKVIDRLSGWKAKLLSAAGRGTLIRSVISSMPVYSMSTFMLPKSVSADLDKATRKFWWCGDAKVSRCWCPSSWDSICRPKSHGGLGFRRFYDLNRALVAKLGWFLQTEGHRLWVQALKQKYFPHSDFLQSSPPSSCS